MLAVVTGAGRGFGSTLVSQALAHGFRVVAIHRSSFSAEAGPEVVSLQADCALDSELDRVWPQVVAEVGQCAGTILINNAGWYIKQPLVETSLADIAATLDSNVRAGMNLTRRLIGEPSLTAIVNIVSTSALRYSVPGSGFANKAAYGGSKMIGGYVAESLVESLPSQVRLINLYPRNINTWAEGPEPDSLDPTDLADWVFDAVVRWPRWQLTQCVMLPVR